MVSMSAGFNYRDVLYLFRAAGVSLQLFGSAIGVGLVIGFITGILRTFPRSRLLRTLAGIYIEFFRSTPLTLQVVVFYFGASILGFNVSRGLVAGVGLFLYAGAYLGEILRAGIESVDRRQWEAAASLGMTYTQVMGSIVLPQALHICVAPAVGFLVSLAKGTSLVSVLGYVELTRAGRLIVERTFAPFQVWGIVMLMYFAICYPISIIGKRLEARAVRKPARG